MIKIGPGGLGTDYENNLNELKRLKLDSVEIEFTYRVYLDNIDAKKIGELAKKLNIEISVHAPYYINLNSEDRKKLEDSKKRILDSCERAHYLGARYVVFHSGFYGKRNKEESYENIKDCVLELQSIIKKNNWGVELAPETMGKVNVFGSLDEILKLVKETKCWFCIDFAHLKARTNGVLDYKKILNQLPKKHLHVHFSGIEYGEKGERKHVLTRENDIKELLNNLKGWDCTIINESPDPWGDAVKTKQLLK